MKPEEQLQDFLLLSRGQWDPDAAREQIEASIAKFYEWYDGNVETGRFRPGSRLTPEAAKVSRSGISTDGPFGEAKEVIGGYWIIRACSLREAAEIAAENPCLRHGLKMEIRPLDSARGTYDNTLNERPRP